MAMNPSKWLKVTLNTKYVPGETLPTTPDSGRHIQDLFSGTWDSRSGQHHQAHGGHLHCCYTMPQSALDTEMKQKQNNKQNNKHGSNSKARGGGGVPYTGMCRRIAYSFERSLSKQGVFTPWIFRHVPLSRIIWTVGVIKITLMANQNFYHSDCWPSRELNQVLNRV